MMSSSSSSSSSQQQQQQQRRIRARLMIVSLLLLIGRNVFRASQTTTRWTMAAQSLMNAEAVANDTTRRYKKVPAVVVESDQQSSAAAAALTSTTRIPPARSYRMYRNETYEQQYVEDYRCTGEREGLDDDLKRAMVFRTIIDTDLNILVMGDSVAVQMSQNLLEAAQVSNKVVHKASWVMRDTGKVYDGLLSGVTNRQGLVAGWRILNFWRPAQEGGPLPNRPGGGWRNDDVTILRQTAMATNGRADFDVLVFRPPQGWMKWDEFTEIALLETIALARDLMGIKLVIFLTVSYSNNVVSLEDIAMMRRVNEMIRSVGERIRRNTTTTGSSGNNYGTTVLILEAGHLIDLTVLSNARKLGLPNVTTTEDDDDDVDSWNFTLPRAKLLTETKWSSGSVSYICGRPVQTVKNEPACIGNLLTNDGQHMCVGTMGGRLNAGIACLIECGTINANRSDYVDDDAAFSRLTQCQDLCNRQFMSLEPIPEALFVPDAAVALPARERY